MTGLVLSVFPGVGILDRAFELEGYCVVRGPDLLWGGDVRRFHPPGGVFDGVIGGPPCKAHSQASGGTSRAPDLIPEFSRVVVEAAPRWFLMENVPGAPVPEVPGYAVSRRLAENRDCGGVQKRTRSLVFGARGAESPIPLEVEWWAAPAALKYAPTVTGNASVYAGAQAWNRYASRSVRTRGFLARAIELQGLPPDYELPGFTVAAAIEAVANGVPIPLGRWMARAIKHAMGAA